MSASGHDCIWYTDSIHSLYTNINVAMRALRETVFTREEKCAIWIWIWVQIAQAQFELSFKWFLNYHSNDDILDHVYAKLYRDAEFEMRNSNDGSDVILRTHVPKYSHSNDHSNCAIKITHHCDCVHVHMVSNTIIQMIIQIAHFCSRVKTVRVSNHNSKNCSVP